MENPGLKEREDEVALPQLRAVDDYGRGMACASARHGLLGCLVAKATNLVLVTAPLRANLDAQLEIDLGTEEDLVAEFVREKVLLNCRDEVPHSVAVVCNDIVWKKDGHASVSATIFVEREGQKGIIVGKGGSMVKKIGVAARADIE
ncbi:MAG: hypothetical protein EGQ34_02775, partial [Sutterella sp.]|nr:hypothetical protein [Sutterella sp.]